MEIRKLTLKDEKGDTYTLRVMERNYEDLHSLVEVWGKFDERIRDFISDRAMCLLDDVSNAISKCESPIEQLMAVALEAQSKVFERTRTHFKGYLGVESQVEIKTGEKTYRADFVIEWEAFRWPDKPVTVAKVIVECDGHAFHERTKEQAKRDKARDRALQAAGYTVLRFTGSEVWADPDACAKEAMALVSAQVRQWHEDNAGE
jgi:very-short-patch-repair endonuclease